MAPSTRITAVNGNNDEGVTKQYVDADMDEIRAMITALGMQHNEMVNQGMIRQANQFGRLAKVEFPKF